jgi:hypothetical protein
MFGFFRKVEPIEDAGENDRVVISDDGIIWLNKVKIFYIPSFHAPDSIIDFLFDSKNMMGWFRINGTKWYPEGSNPEKGEGGFYFPVNPVTLDTDPIIYGGHFADGKRRDPTIPVIGPCIRPYNPIAEQSELNRKNGVKPNLIAIQKDSLVIWEAKQKTPAKKLKRKIEDSRY